MSDKVQDRPALTDVVITPEMIEAGIAAFEDWFLLPAHQELLVGLPPRDSISALLAAIISSMLSIAPDRTNQRAKKMQVKQTIIGIVASALGVTVWLDEVPCGKPVDTPHLDPA